MRHIFSLISTLVTAFLLLATTTVQADRLKDLTSIAGVRANQLVGYGLVVGLPGTGDGSSTLTLVNALGMVTGPLLASIFMAYFGAYGWFVYMIVIYSLVAPYNYARMRVGRTSDIYQDNTPSMMVPRTTSPLGMQLAMEQVINKIEEEESTT